MELEFRTTQQTFTAQRQWKESIFMVRMGPIQRTFHMVNPDKVTITMFGPIFYALCGADAGDWRSIQAGDLPFGGWFCARCAPIAVKRRLIVPQEH